MKPRSPSWLTSGLRGVDRAGLLRLKFMSLREDGWARLSPKGQY